MPRRIHLFVDETARQGFFLVAVVAVDAEALTEVERAFQGLEDRSGRGGRKWVDSADSRKGAFLTELAPLLQRTLAVCWRNHPEPAGDRIELTAKTVADAALSLDAQAQFYCTVDGYSKPESQRVAKALRLVVQEKGTRGKRDGPVPLLRMADAMAGFLGDMKRGKSLALGFWDRLQGGFREV